MQSKANKIIIFSPIDLSSSIHGSQQDILNRIKLFQEIGYRVIVASFEKKHIETRNNINRIIELIEKEKPDILWFEYLIFAKIVKDVRNRYPGLKIYFRNHNYEFGHVLEKWIDNFKRSKDISSLPSLLFNLWQIRKYENLMFKHSDKVFAISKLDMEKYRKYSNLYYLPFFKDYEFNYEVKKGKDRLDVFYFGSDFKNNVNLSGLEFIHRKIIPCLKNNKVFFHILGKNCPLNIKHPQIKLQGFVGDSDSFLKNMDVAIVPVEIGYGMKIKAYESLKKGFPTILSERSHKIFGGEESRDYLVARNPKQWAQHINRLFDEKLRKELICNCKKFMLENFNKENLLGFFEQINNHNSSD